MPDQYYLLTLSETNALLKGSYQRRIETASHFRNLETLLFNVNVEKQHRLTPETYRPLPGDHSRGSTKATGEVARVPPEVFAQIVNQLFRLPAPVKPATA